MRLVKAITHLNRALVLLLCVSFASLLAVFLRAKSHSAKGATDFGIVYFGSRCVIGHKDPYDPKKVLREFEADGGEFPTENPRIAEQVRNVITVIIYPPTAFFLLAPLAALSYPTAEIVWLSLMGTLLAAAAFLIWDLGSDSPAISGSMAIFMLLNCVLLLWMENPAGIVVPFCVIAVWCFLKQRLAIAGVVMLAVALVIKPHDAGFIWLYFLLAGGRGRKRALQTLAVAGVLGVCSLVWIAPSSPHWFQEWSSHFSPERVQETGRVPGPTGAAYHSFVPDVCLQDAISTFKNDPHVYNAVSYVIAGGLILLWGIGVVRKRRTPEGELLALAAISALTLLPIYHESNDAKLLMMMIPASAMLWRRKGPERWFAMVLTWAAILATSDALLLPVAISTQKLAVSASSLAGRMTLLALHPAPLVLLAAGCFYLWAYVRYIPRADRKRSTAVEATATITG